MAATTSTKPKRPRGRPPVAPELRRRPAGLSLNQVELDAIRSKAEVEGLTVSSYVRRQLGLEPAAS